MANLFLKIDGGPFLFAVHEGHDDLVDPGRCHMVVSLNSITKLQALWKQKGSPLYCELFERVGNQDVPVNNHRSLRIVHVTASNAASLLDATLIGGGEVVADLGP
jgi:hypothetical protein